MPEESVTTAGQSVIQQEKPSTTELIKKSLYGPERTFEEVENIDVGKGITLGMLEESLRERGFSEEKIEAFRQEGLKWVEFIARANKLAKGRQQMVNRALAGFTGIYLGFTIGTSLLGNTAPLPLDAITQHALLFAPQEVVAILLTQGTNSVIERIINKAKKQAGIELAESVINAKKLGG